MTVETDADRIARRYPVARTPRWLWVVPAVALAVVGGGWTVWSGIHGATPPISAKIVSFDVTSDQTVQVLLTTQRPDPSRPATCTVTAQATSYETVGQFPLFLGPGTQELENHDVTIRTFKRGTSVKVEGCRPA